MLVCGYALKHVCAFLTHVEVRYYEFTTYSLLENHEKHWGSIMNLFGVF